MSGRTPADVHEDWRKSKYLDWLLTPPQDREPRSKRELAGVLGVDIRSLNYWSEEPSFRDEWQRRVSQIVGDPSRGQRIMDTLFVAATDPANRNHVTAAKLYLEATQAIRPSLEVTVRKVSDLTDSELDALIAQGAQELRAAREAVNDAGV